MDKDTKITIQMYLAAGLAKYLEFCYGNKELPKEEVKKYFTQKIKELGIENEI